MTAEKTSLGSTHTTMTSGEGDYTCSLRRMINHRQVID